MNTDTTEQTEIKLLPRDNGMTEERFAEVLAYLRERNKDPERRARIERMYAESVEYRRQVDEEMRRRLDEEEGK